MHGLGRKVLVVAFDGWNDAGEAASAALRVIREAHPYEPVFSVDPELYFDYQYNRPTIGMDADGQRSLTWPEATILRPQGRGRGTQLWQLMGTEPSRAWKSFANEIVDVALREDITGIVSLGSMLGDVPHTRPIRIQAGSENDVIREAMGLERSMYEGPVGILSVLSAAAEQVGIPTAALWASVPHYVAGHSPSPKATLALLDRLEDLTSAELPRGGLAAESVTWEATINAAAEDDEEMSEYIRHLERTRDMVDSPEASGDGIAQAFEQYLRGDGDANGKPGRDGTPRR